MSNALTKSVYVLIYTEFIGWILTVSGALGLSYHIQIIHQGFFQAFLLIGIILIIASRFLRWIFYL